MEVPCRHNGSIGIFVEDIELVGPNRHFKGYLAGNCTAFRHCAINRRIASGDLLIGGAIGSTTMEGAITGSGKSATGVEHRNIQHQQHIVGVLRHSAPILEGQFQALYGDLPASHRSYLAKTIRGRRW